MEVDSVIIPIFKFLVLIGILFLIGAIINIIIDKIRGKSNQHIFRKRNIDNSNEDTLALLFNKVNGYKRIIKYDDIILFINEYGIKAILICDIYGILSGNENDKSWQLKANNRDTLITNPIIGFRDKLTKISSKIGNEEITEYILLGGHCFLNIEFKSINLVRTNKIFYTLSKKDGNKKYSVDEIDNIYEKLKM
ncbi:MAG TPA: hypothetical protein PLV83_05335 [Bacilli bacterium]|nr:hypothetical protein [Bacilli bacterium]